MPELKRNILNFGYTINFKYQGMLAHSFDRFYVVTKFILPSVPKFPPIDIDSKCSYLNTDLSRHQMEHNIFLFSVSFVRKIVLFIGFYKKQTDYYNNTDQKFKKKNKKSLWYYQDRKEKYNCFISNQLHQFGK